MPTFDDFRPCKEVPPAHGRRTDRDGANQALVRAFLRSGAECARYECETAQRAKSYAAALRKAAKGQPVVVSRRDKCVYLSKAAPR